MATVWPSRSGGAGVWRRVWPGPEPSGTVVATGSLEHDFVAGPAGRPKEGPWRRPTSSTRFAVLWASAAVGWPQVHPADLGAHSITALMDRTGIDPAAVEDVVFGCVDTIGSAGRRHRPNSVVRCRYARGGPGYHHRPTVRLFAAGGPLRRPGSPLGHHRPGGGRRGAEHVGHPHFCGDDRRRAVRIRRIRSRDPRVGRSAMATRR